MLLRLFAVIMLLLLPAVVQAQSAATLVADSVTIPAGTQQLIAAGNVEVFYDGTRLSARRITFDQATDRLVIDGPIFIVTADGTILTATQGDLDPTLANGILRGARLVLDQQLQLAANQIDRVEGRFTQLYQVAATSCQVCESGQAPLWEVRARRVVHDEQAQQLYFDDAVFRIAGVPVFYLPRMRLPDPTLERATGLLTPEFRTTNTLGTGIKLPYFIRLGDHRDLTLTPYLSNATTTLEATYRQAFLRGDIEVETALTRDDLDSNMRGYLFGRGAFDLGADYVLRFDLEMTSDDAYLLDYGYSDKDRLDSEVSLTRVRDRDLTRASLTAYSSLRAGEPTGTLPPLLADASREQRLTRWGGTLTLTSDIEGHLRDTSVLDTASGLMVDDAVRLGVGAGWQGSRALDSGLVVETGAGMALDYYAFSNDSAADDTLRGTAHAQTTLRYPLIRRSARAVHILEPVVQLAWSDTSGGVIPNEDSTAIEFDQASLLALSRFSGEDAVETGLRGALGLTWTRMGQGTGSGGWDSTLSLGRVLRADPELSFSPTSGLDTTLSDWLIAGQLRLPSGFALDSRLIIDDTLGINKSETRVAWASDRLDLTAGYIFLPADPFESRPDNVSEWTIDSTYRVNDVWSLGLDARYDVAADEPSRAGLEIGWQNECVAVDFSVSRRFTTSTTLTPSTDYGLSIELNGFGAGRSLGRPSNRCTD